MRDKIEIKILKFKNVLQEKYIYMKLVKIYKLENIIHLPLTQELFYKSFICNFISSNI